MSQYDFGNLVSPLSGQAFIDTHLEVPQSFRLEQDENGEEIDPDEQLAESSYNQIHDDNTSHQFIAHENDHNDIDISAFESDSNCFISDGHIAHFYGQKSKRLFETSDS